MVGPYIPVKGSAFGGKQVAVAGEAHNPQAIRAPDGTFLLMDSYNGPDAGCSTNITYSNCKFKNGPPPGMSPGTQSQDTSSYKTPRLVS